MLSITTKSPYAIRALTELARIGGAGPGPDRRAGPPPRHPGPVPRAALRGPAPRGHPALPARRQGRLLLRPRPGGHHRPRGRRAARRPGRRRRRVDLRRGRRRRPRRPRQGDDRRRRRAREPRRRRVDVLHLETGRVLPAKRWFCGRRDHGMTITWRTDPGDAMRLGDATAPRTRRGSCSGWSYSHGRPIRIVVGHVRSRALGTRAARTGSCPCSARAWWHGLASAEVVVHEPAGDAGGGGDVLDRDLVVGALGEQGVGCVEDLSRVAARGRAGGTSASS